MERTPGRLKSSSWLVVLGLAGPESHRLAGPLKVPVHSLVVRFEDGLKSEREISSWVVSIHTLREGANSFILPRCLRQSQSSHSLEERIVFWRKMAEVGAGMGAEGRSQSQIPLPTFEEIVSSQKITFFSKRKLTLLPCVKTSFGSLFLCSTDKLLKWTYSVPLKRPKQFSPGPVPSTCVLAHHPSTSCRLHTFQVLLQEFPSLPRKLYPFVGLHCKHYPSAAFFDTPRRQPSSALLP